VPSGLVIREFFLTLLLVPDLTPFVGSDAAETKAAAAVILLRLVWTASEMVIVPALYFLPARLWQSRPVQ
jgi:hypothetical protein